jgi:molybdopterin-synthase adenylyltransferase
MTNDTQAHTAPYELYKRQLGFFNPDDHGASHVNIIGLGGIGSFAAFGVAKLGVPNITVVDDDTVELHNVPNQFHATDQLGLTKTDAMLDTAFAYTGTTLNAIEGQIGKDSPDDWNPKGVVISGVDSMKARMDIWDNGKIKFNPAVSHYIDARIAGQLVVVYCVNPNNLEDIKHYEQTLHSDEDAEPAPCTERGVIDVGLSVGALLTNMTRHALTGDDVASVTTINLALPPMTSGEWVL